MVGKSLSHYKIEAELGRGGTGIVYRAEDTKLDRTVAIKVLPSGALASEDDRARFYREAKAAAQLHHPHIASVFEIDEAVPEESREDDLRPFIAMEYIEGETLHDRISKGPLKLDEAVRIANEIASALEAAHEKSIVHRDIKAANVMLTSKGSAKVLDFGLAQTTASTKLTRMGSTLGTVAYMSPEQARGEEVDSRTDLWSLGAVLYEMIAGKSPFPGDYEQAVVYEILNQDPEPLTAVRTGVPMGLEWIVSKCLAKKPEHRYQSATELNVDLSTVDLSQTGLSRVSTTSSTGVHLAPVTDKPARSFMETIKNAWVPIVVAAIVALGIGYSISSEPKSDKIARTMRVSVPGIKRIEDPTMSPDGTRIAFQGVDSMGRGGVFEYELLRNGKLIFYDGSDGGSEPAYSPDGKFLTYQGSEDGLNIHSVPGGAPVKIAAGGQYWGPLWISNDQILAQKKVVSRRKGEESGSENNVPQSLSILSVRGADPIVLTVPDHTRGHLKIRPTALDPTRSFALGSFSPLDQDGVVDLGIINLRDGSYEILKEGAGYGYFLDSSHIVYTIIDGLSALNPGTIVVEEFSFDTMKLAGFYRQIEENVPGYSIEISEDNSLLHSPVVADLTNIEMVKESLDFAGDRQVIYTVSSFGNPALSPDGSRLAIEEAPVITGVFPTRIRILSVDGVQDNTLVIGDSLGRPSWSFDGKSVFYGELKGGISRLMRKSPGQAGGATVENEDACCASVSRDGRYLAFSKYSTSRRVHGLYVEDRQTRNVTELDSSSGTAGKAFSPDGRFIVYQRIFDNTSEIIVRSLAGTQEQVLADGTDPRWDTSGDFIYYNSNNGFYLSRIPVSTASGFARRGPTEDILLNVWGSRWTIDFDRNLIYRIRGFNADLGGPDAILEITENFDSYVKHLFE